MNELIYKIETIVRNCGTQILQAKNEKMNIEKKEGIGNIVTEYDKKIQKELKEKLLELLPDAKFIGEEDDLYKNVLENGYTFIVNPIDVTTNFSRHFSLSAISVGLLKDAKPYIAVCYNPYLDEMYIAQKNKGAYLNNKSLKVSDKTLSERIVLSGNAPYYKELSVHHTLWFFLYLSILLFHILSLIICYIFLVLVDKTIDIHSFLKILIPLLFYLQILFFQFFR